MKNIYIYFYSIAFAALLLVGCQKDELLPAGSCVLTYDVALPDSYLSKAIGDQVNVRTLYYQVYEGKDITSAQDIDPIISGKTQMGNPSTSVSFNLVNTQSYTVLFWADCSELDGENIKVGTRRYITDDLRKVSLASSDQDCNDESMAAFYYKDIIESASVATPSVSLSRAVAQLNVLTTSYVYGGKNVVPGTSSLTLSGVSTEFDLLTGQGCDIVEKTYASAVVDQTSTMTISGKTYRYAAMCYLFVPGADSSISVSYKLTPVYQDGSSSSFSEVSNTVNQVKVKANHRTNIAGDLLTSKSVSSIVVDPQDPSSGVMTFTDPANCYIVSQSGDYSFKAVRGNSTETLASAHSAEVLWESFGTTSAPVKGDLLTTVNYNEGNVEFTVNDTFKEGNALIAVKDASDNILWSWHIWLTDKPADQEYPNEAGIMMDRNLGATSADAEDGLATFGLMYQWGRKDPFMGAAGTMVFSKVASTMEYVEPVLSSEDDGTNTVEYATAHPTTFICCSSYTGWEGDASNSLSDLWSGGSQVAKTIYDPCPAGYRVPSGGASSVWTLAGFSQATAEYVEISGTVSVSGFKFADGTLWYPFTGYLFAYNGEVYKDDNPEPNAYYLASGSTNTNADVFRIAKYDSAFVEVTTGARANGSAVRCIKE